MMFTIILTVTLGIVEKSNMTACPVSVRMLLNVGFAAFNDWFRKIDQAFDMGVIKVISLICVNVRLLDTL